MVSKKAGVLIGLVAILSMFSALAYSAYPGSLTSFLVFDVSFVIMILLALPRPRSHAYIFFALMLFLGFWSKFMLYMALGVPLLEPIGNFSGTPDAWDRALNVASVAAVGVSVMRLIYLMWMFRRGAMVGTRVESPQWYGRWRVSIWVVSAVATLVLNVANFQFAFYQVGVNPRLVLPYHLNVPLAWLINIGFAFWFSVLIHWESIINRKYMTKLLVVPIIEGLLTSISALSRSIYLLHSIPYFFGAASQSMGCHRKIGSAALLRLVLAWMFFFAVSLALVSLSRVGIFHLGYVPTFLEVPDASQIDGEAALRSRMAEDAPSGNEDSNGATDKLEDANGKEWKSAMSSFLVPILHQISRLFLNRWIGLEGVLAVSSYPGLGQVLITETLNSPKLGERSVYQIISNSSYKQSDRFTFASLPGVVGVLFYSGSLLVVAAGATLVTFVLMMTERAAARFTANPFFAAMVAMSAANVVCQVEFPYLLGVFFAQLWVAIAFVWLLSVKSRSH